MGRLVVFVAVLSLVAGYAASDSLSEGEAALMYNNPAAAVPLLEAAIREAPKEEKAYLELGYAYQLLGRYDDAIMVLNKGLGVSIALRHKFYYNIGNNLYAQGKYAFSKEMYALAIAADPGFASPYLNRAQVYVKEGAFAEAIADYRKYLALAPTTPKRAEIEALIAALDKAIAAKAAADAIAAANAAAAAAAQAALLQQVSTSLQDAVVDSTSVSVGTGDVQGYDDGLDIE